MFLSAFNFFVCLKESYPIADFLIFSLSLTILEFRMSILDAAAKKKDILFPVVLWRNVILLLSSGMLHDGRTKESMARGDLSKNHAVDK